MNDVTLDHIGHETGKLINFLDKWLFSACKSAIYFYGNEFFNKSQNIYTNLILS